MQSLELFGLILKVLGTLILRLTNNLLKGIFIIFLIAPFQSYNILQKIKILYMLTLQRLI